MRITQYQSNFSTGEIDPLLRARTDLQQYQNALEEATNVVVQPQGGISRRDGLELIFNFGSAFSSFKIIPFEFGVSDSYLLVVVAGRIYVFKNKGLQRNINSTGNDYIAATDITEAMIDELEYTQAVDTLILCHEDLQTKRLVRNSDTSWTFENLPLTNLPQYAYALDEHSPNFTITPSATTGNITITASAVTTDTGQAQAGSSNTITLKAATSYTSDDDPNGMFIKITSGTGSGQTRHVEDYVAATKVLTVYPAWDTAPDATSNYEVKAFKEAAVNEYAQVNSTFGRARYIEYVSDTAMKAVVEVPFFDANPVVAGNWNSEHGYEDVWSSTRGWPRSATFHEGRLYFGGSKSRPNTVWGSRVIDYFNFDAGTALDDEAVETTINTNQLNAIVNIVSGADLRIFSTGGEFIIVQSDDTPITPSNFLVRPQTRLGSKAGVPIEDLNGATIFVQRQGKSINAFQFGNDTRSYQVQNISLLSSHLLNDPVDIAVRRSSSTDEADRLFVVNNGDGSMAVYSILTGQNVIAPSKFTTDGEFVAVGVETSNVFSIVKRTFGSVSGSDPYLERPVYDGINLSVGLTDTSPTGIFFKPDGTRLYWTGDSNNRVYEYSLSTAWDLSSATSVRNFDVSTQETSPEAIFFKPDGTKFYIVGSNGDEVNEYDLSTAWDVSTASHNQLFDVSSQNATPQGLFFKPDGNKMFVLGSDGNDTVYEYALSTPWDISTATYTQSFLTNSQTSLARGIFFVADGGKMFVVDEHQDAVFQYSLSTAWDISTASYDSISFSVLDEDASAQDIFFKSDGSKMYIVGDDTNSIYQYSTSNNFYYLELFNSEFTLDSAVGGQTIDFAFGTNPFLNSASYDSVSLDVSAQDATPSGLFFKPDGTRLYITGTTNDDIYEYSLSTAWDITTASYVRTLASDYNPRNVFFKPNGTELYIVRSIPSFASNLVEQHTLTTAWDISTSSSTQTFSIATQDTSAQGIFFKPDGKKMFVTGIQNDAVYEYALSTAWDISTASYTQNFSLTGQGYDAPLDLFFNADGTKMFILGAFESPSSTDSVYQYSLLTAWDVSTISYDGISFSVNAEDYAGQALYFKDDNSKMYIAGPITSRIHQYSTSHTTSQLEMKHLPGETLHVIADGIVQSDATVASSTFTADSDGIFTLKTNLVAGDLDLDGVFVSSGTASFNGIARGLIFQYSSLPASGEYITIEGTDIYDKPLTETIMTSIVTYYYSVNKFKTVTNINQPFTSASVTLYVGVTETTTDVLTLASPATTSFEVGLDYTVQAKTMPTEPTLSSGSIHGMKKRVVQVDALVDKTKDLKINGKTIAFDTESGSSVIAEYTGLKTAHGLLGYANTGQITLTQTDPLPMTVLGLEYKLSTGS